MRAPSACAVLAARGLHGVGLWAAACACGGDADAAGAPLALLRRAGSASAPLRLARAELAPLWDVWWAGAGPGPPPPLPAPGAAPPPGDWRALYAARGLDPASPAALALDAAATIARALAALPPARSAELLVVHVAGAAREAAAWPLLLELAPAAGRRVDAHLIGPEVPPWAHGRRVELAGAGSGGDGSSEVNAPDTAITFWRGLYHDVWREAGGAGGALPAPDLLAAPNAGLAAYAAWRPTLELLRAWREAHRVLSLSSPAGPLTLTDHAMVAPPRPVRVLITDYSEEAALRAAAAVRGVVGAAPGAVALNALRAPLLRRTADNRLPVASNAFAFEFDI